MPMDEKYSRAPVRESTQTLAQDGFSARLPMRQSPFEQVKAEGHSGMPSAPAYTRRRAAAAAAAANAAISAAGGVVPGRVLELQQNGDGTVTVVRCTNAGADDIDIQFEAGVCTVTAIAPHAFENMTALRRVILPQGLKSIGEMAFSGCIHLTQMTIPGQVQRIGTLAFAKCTGLMRVRIEPGVKALGPSCFSKCSALIRVDIPSSVVQMGGGVFFGCAKGLTMYGAEGTYAQQYAAFNGIGYDAQAWREDEVLILEELEDGCLRVMGARNERSTRIEIPSELCGRRITQIAPRAFIADSALEQLVIGSEVQTIGESAFYGCRSLVGVSFERGLQNVGDSAFAGCSELTQVILPWGVSSVGRMAFCGCTRLAFVKMPPTTRVREMAFDGCAPHLRVFGGVSAGQGTSGAEG